MNSSARPQPVVAGIDGSKSAIRAALWAVDEAACRDVPLRLVYAMEPGDTRQAAETALAQARTAVLACGTPVRLETEVSPEPAVASLIGASSAAAMICVGAVGLRHFRPGRVGSTAAALAVSARCPVAIVRGRDDHPPTDRIVVEVDGSPDNGVLLRLAVEEARLRGAAVEAVVCRRTVTTEGVADTESDRRAVADLDRRLSTWKRRDPQLRVESAAVHGTLLEFVAGHRRSVGLVVVGSHNRQHVGELVGPAGSAILQDAGCSLLIVNRHHL